MNREQAKLEELWMVELHPKGGSQIRQVREVMQEKKELLLQGKFSEWQEVAVRETFGEAKKALAKIRKEMRKTKSAQSVADAHQPGGQKQAGDREQGLEPAGDPIFGVACPEELPRTGQAKVSKDGKRTHGQYRQDQFNQDHEGSIA